MSDGEQSRVSADLDKRIAADPLVSLYIMYLVDQIARRDNVLAALRMRDLNQLTKPAELCLN